jgi:hypothetical protein
MGPALGQPASLTPVSRLRSIRSAAAIRAGLSALTCIWGWPSIIPDRAVAPVSAETACRELLVSFGKFTMCQKQTWHRQTQHQHIVIHQADRPVSTWRAACRPAGYCERDELPPGRYAESSNGGTQEGRKHAER